MSELMSIRGFAKTVNLSEGAIRKAIKGKRIVSGYANGKIISDIARTELGLSASISSTRSDAIFELADEKEVIKKESPKERVEKKKKVESVKEDYDLEAEETESENSFKGANRMLAKYKAKIAKLEYEEKEKQLVRISDISKALFAMGTELRIALLSLPEKTIDNILASIDRVDAIKLLNDEIEKILIKVSSIQEKQFK